jgi:cell division protein FtsN
MAHKESAKTEWESGSSKWALSLLLLLLVVAVLGGAYFFRHGDRQPPPTLEPTRKKVKKIPQAKVTPPPVPAAGASQPEIASEATILPTTQIKQESKPGKERYYQVKAGDTLWKIAGLPEVYEDSTQWEILYLANPEQIVAFYRKSSAPYVIMVPGISLWVPALDQVEKLLDVEAMDRFWVVQLSANLNIRYALDLVTKLNCFGSRLYVMEKASGHQTWHLVRMGFYSNKDEAHDRAKAVLKQAGLTEYLVFPASPHEIRHHLPLTDRSTS